MDINKLKFNILRLYETRLSSDIEMLHHVTSFDLLTNNRSTLGGGTLLYVRDKCNANKTVHFSIMLECLETIFVSFSVGKTIYVIENV